MTKPDTGLAGEVEFRDVCFRYPDADGDMLQHISLLPPIKGETVALIGATGCGKSTVINLIPRFYDVTQGQVLSGRRGCAGVRPEGPEKQDRLCFSEGDAVFRYGAEQRCLW